MGVNAIGRGPAQTLRGPQLCGLVEKAKSNA
jgi:hypothetical protein